MSLKSALKYNANFIEGKKKSVRQQIKSSISCRRNVKYRFPKGDWFQKGEAGDKNWPACNPKNLFRNPNIYFN